MDVLTDSIVTTLQSFDFAFCISVNILTYIVNKTITDIKGTAISTWAKRLILLASIFVISAIWYVTNQDIKLIINSAILAPVFWSWVVKPLFKKLDIDYNQATKP